MRLLTEEQKHWVEVIGDFCKKEIEPIMLDWDKVVDPSKAIPFEPYAKAFKLGLNSFEIPKEYGGNKVDLATAEVMYEEMGYYDGNFASVMQTTNLALKPILIGGTPEQVQYFSKHILEGKGYAAFALTEPQSGSDASNVKTTAVKDGDEWVINGEKCSAAVDATGSTTSLSSISYSDTTWSLLFNCNTIFSSTELRQALAGVARDAAEVPPTGLFAAADSLIPAGLNVDGMNYRDTVGDVSPAPVDVKALYLAARQGMANSDFNKITLMLPAGCGLNEAAETINGAWQKELSLFFSIEEVDEETFRKRLAEGDYTIALAPVSAESGSVYNTLAQFTPAGGGLTGYSNALYATQLEASTHANGSTRCRLLGDCERQLLSDCVVVPLFSQQKRLLIASGVKNLIFDPFGPVLDLTYATKE